MNEPEEILVCDEFGTTWTIRPWNKLWPDVLVRYRWGEDPLMVPLKIIRDNFGWGWWTVDEKVQQFINDLGVPIPSLKTLPDFTNMPLLDLVNLLQQYGAFLVFLEAQVGLISAKYLALRESLNSAVMVGAVELPDKMTEKAKEARIIAGNETLRETRRMEVETQAQLAAAKGIRDAYQQAWDTVSRAISALTAEATMVAKRG